MELQEGKQYKVNVVRIVSAGAVVKLEDTTTELIHISKFSKSYVKDPNDYVNVGDCFSALAVVGGKGKPELSLVHLNIPSKRSNCDKVSKVADDINTDNSRTTSINIDKAIEMMKQEYSDKFQNDVKDASGHRSRKRNKNNYDRYKYAKFE